MDNSFVISTKVHNFLEENAQYGIV